MKERNCFTFSSVREDLCDINTQQLHFVVVVSKKES